MALSSDQIDQAIELFDGVGQLSYRRMFGGMCLYSDGTVFALMRSDGTLMLKAVGDFRDRVTREGWVPWHHVRKNGTRTSMPYWEIPESVIDEPDTARALATESLAAM
ncbi:TfoX/Sxy family protein [Sulfitobacter sp. LCG007]